MRRAVGAAGAVAEQRSRLCDPPARPLSGASACARRHRDAACCASGRRPGDHHRLRQRPARQDRQRRKRHRCLRWHTGGLPRDDRFVRWQLRLGRLRHQPQGGRHPGERRHRLQLSQRLRDGERAVGDGRVGRGYHLRLQCRAGSVRHRLRERPPLRHQLHLWRRLLQPGRVRGDLRDRLRQQLWQRGMRPDRHSELPERVRRHASGGLALPGRELRWWRWLRLQLRRLGYGLRRPCGRHLQLPPR